MSLTYYLQPTYKIEFWSGSTKLRGFGYGYTNKEVVSFKIKPGLTKALGSFEITIADTGSDSNGISNGKAFSNIEVFNTVKMWYGHTGSGLTPPVAEMFVGKIDTKEISWGESGCYRTFTGRDSGEPLQRILQRRAYTGSLSSSATSLKDTAGLSAANTFISGSTDDYCFVQDNTSCFNGLMEISDFDNKDFYIGTGSELHWFPRQSYVDTSGISFEEGLDIFSYRYAKDLADVKNNYYVFGMTREDLISGSSWPTDGDSKTQTVTTGWSGWFKAKTGSTSTALTPTSHTDASPPGSAATGSACIYITRTGNQVSSGSEYEQHLILDWSSTTAPADDIMLNSGNIFHSYLAYVIESPIPHDKIQPFIRLYSYNTGSDYFECLLERPILAYTLVWNERSIVLGPNSEGNSATGSIGDFTGSYKWTRYGNPDWYSIRYVDFGINFTPNTLTVGLAESTYVDGMYFGVPFQYHTSGSASINAYGLRTEIINDDKINSTLYAKNMGDTLLSINQIPTTQIEIKTVTRDYVVGTSYPIVINSENIDSNFELIDLEHNWSDNTLTSKCLFTNQAQKRIPIPIINYPVQQAEKELGIWRKMSSFMGGVPILASR